MGKIKTLIVDDSALMRKLLSAILQENNQIEVIATAPNGKIALEKISRLKPDVITLDVEMPGMNGIETLKRIMSEFPTPVLMISSFTDKGASLTFNALQLGAVDFITKPDSVRSKKIEDLREEILMKIEAASKVKIKKIPQKRLTEIEAEETNYKKTGKEAAHIGLQQCRNIVAIGISTGGPDVLGKILPQIPADINAGILIVQHMPAGFTRVFAERMNMISNIEVKEASMGDIILPGRAIIAKGDHHLKIKKERHAYTTSVVHGERVSLFRPSIDVMMKSVAEVFKDRVIGVIMTGMGYDGVEGISDIKHAGGKTIAQDKASSVVFGMNKLAIANGSIARIAPADRIVPAILNYLEQM